METYHNLARILVLINTETREIFDNKEYLREYELLRAMRKQLAWRILESLGKVDPKTGNAW